MAGENPSDKNLLEHLKKTLPTRPTRDNVGTKTHKPDETVLVAWQNLAQHPDFGIVLEDLAQLCCFSRRAENLIEVAGHNLFLEILTRAGVGVDDIIRQIAYGQRRK